MAVTILTVTGSKWVAKDGRITRHPAPGGDPLPVIENAPFHWLHKPVEGGVGFFRLAGSVKPTHTGTIVSVQTDVTVKVHDEYDRGEQELLAIEAALV